MKIMHTADLHIGKVVNEFSMLEDQKYIFKQMLDIMRKEKVELLLLAGDIYDRSVPSADAVELFDWFLTEISKLNVVVAMISGNHDSGERLSFGSELLKKQQVHIVGNIQNSHIPVTLQDQYGKINLWFLPFFRPAELKQLKEQEALELRDYDKAVEVLINKMPLKKDERNVLLTHHFVVNCGSELEEPEQVEESDSEQPLSIGGIEQVDYHRFDDFDYVALGHLHGAQRVGRDMVRYSGSPLKYSFSEQFHHKSVVLIDMEEKGKISFELCPLKPMRDVRKIKGKLEDLIKKDVVESENPEDYIGVTLTNEEEIYDAITTLRAYYPNIMQLSFERKSEKGKDIEQTIETVQKKTPFELTKDFLLQVEGEIDENIQQKREHLLEQWLREMMEGGEK